MESPACVTNFLSTLNVSQMRTLNRYHLHPQNLRCCSKCFKIYKGIRENFHVKKYYKSGTIGFNVWCKKCKNDYGAEITAISRQNPEKFITKKLTTYKSRSKEQNRPFDLDAEYLIQLWNFQNGKCFYTGEAIDFTLTTVSQNYPHMLTPSLDRLSPMRGYVKGNVVWCSYKINRMKSDLTYKEFIELSMTVLRNKGVI